MNKQKALVTGGAGFIGSHLCEYLLAKGWSVTCLDNFSTGNKNNLKICFKNNKFTLIEGCATDSTLLNQRLSPPDVIFHLAAVVGVRKVIDNPVKTIEINHAATKNILQLGKNYNCRVFITSSSEVYGDNPKDFFCEEDVCIIGPSQQRRWCYSASKLLDEFHALAYHYTYNLKVTIVRLFNTIGLRQVGTYGMVLPTLLQQASTSQPLTVYGSGEQKRCFTYVNDIVKSIYLLSRSKQAIGKIFNIGNTEETSINDLAKYIIEATKSKSKIVHLSYKDAYGESFSDVDRRSPDITKLKKIISYYPQTGLKEALKLICNLS